MFKALIKLFIPSDKKLSDMAAQKIAETVNQSGREDLIARYAQMAESATEVQKKIAGWLSDGTIDEMETSEISEEIRPYIAKLMELI